MAIIKKIAKVVGVSAATLLVLGFFTMTGYVSIDSKINPKNYQDVERITAERKLEGTDYKVINPTKTKIADVNKDGLQDLIYSSGEIYLQTKEGNFVSYKDVLQQEKSKLDSAYRAKADSLKGIYENKLEKEVK